MITFTGYASSKTLRLAWDRADRAARKNHHQRQKERQTPMTIQFQVGETYCARSICDYNTIFRFKVISRSAKRLTLKMYDDGKTAQRGIYLYEGVEQCKPLGTYSMCPVIRADKTT